MSDENERPPQQLLIRFRGICAHLDDPNDKARKEKERTTRKRTVLMRHRNGSLAIEHHIPYVEFYAEDVDSISSGLKLLRYTRPGFDGTFARVDLPENPRVITEIRLKNVEQGYVREERNYSRDVPHFGEILQKFGRKDLRVAPGLLARQGKDVDASRATAFFDMPNGFLVAGEPEAIITRFKPEVEFKARRLARWADLYATIPAGPVVLQLETHPGGESEAGEIRFKETLRMLTIGNEPERLILGLIGSSIDEHAGSPHGSARARDHEAPKVQPTGHFIMYYDIFETPPRVMPVPIPTQITGAGCPNNNEP